MRGQGGYLRSIPARAGEPQPARPRHPTPRVYPRACGGTQAQQRLQGTHQGLSPRVRGNPLPVRPPLCQVKVYPRACGGTGYNADLADRLTGLSPRVRGNLDLRGFVFPIPGSIPARAGEPLSTDCFLAMIWVYPRACGGTRPQREQWKMA